MTHQLQSIFNNLLASAPPVAEQRGGEEGEDAVAVEVGLARQEAQVPAAIIPLQHGGRHPDDLHHRGHQEEDVEAEEDAEHDDRLAQHLVHVHPPDDGQERHGSATIIPV